MKCLPTFMAAHGLLGTFEEILLEDVRFERAARFAGNNEKRLRHVDLVFEGFDLRGICGVEYVQNGKMGNASERHSQDFGTKTRSTHAQEEYVLEAPRLNFLRDLLQLLLLRGLFFNDVEPAQPIGFVGARPKAAVPIPQDASFSRPIASRPSSISRSRQGFRAGKSSVGSRSFL